MHIAGDGAATFTTMFLRQPSLRSVSMAMALQFTSFILTGKRSRFLRHRVMSSSYGTGTQLCAPWFEPMCGASDKHKGIFSTGFQSHDLPVSSHSVTTREKIVRNMQSVPSQPTRFCSHSTVSQSQKKQQRAAYTVHRPTAASALVSAAVSTCAVLGVARGSASTGRRCLQQTMEAEWSTMQGMDGCAAAFETCDSGRRVEQKANKRHASYPWKHPCLL